MGRGWLGCLCVRHIPPRARVPGDKQLTAQLYVLAEERFKRQTPAQRWPHNSPEECIELATIYALPPSGAEPPGALLEREARNRHSLTRAHLIVDIAILPAFARFKRPDHRVVSGAKVRAGVFVF